MTNKVYIPVREGVYRHELLGVFAELDAAIDMAGRAIENETDHYHTGEVYEFEVGSPVKDGRKAATVKWVRGGWPFADEGWNLQVVRHES